jgi:chromosome segregation ATPase
MRLAAVMEELHGSLATTRSDLLECKRVAAAAQQRLADMEDQHDQLTTSHKQLLLQLDPNRHRLLALQAEVAQLQRGASAAEAQKADIQDVLAAAEQVCMHTGLYCVEPAAMLTKLRSTPGGCYSTT